MDTLASGVVVSARALVALSEDRQWLVVLDHQRWSLLERDWGSYHLITTFEDTGQDAHEVLREFLEGRS